MIVDWFTPLTLKLLEDGPIHLSEKVKTTKPRVNRNLLSVWKCFSWSRMVLMGMCRYWLTLISKDRFESCLITMHSIEAKFGQQCKWFLHAAYLKALIFCAPTLCHVRNRKCLMRMFEAEVLRINILAAMQELRLKYQTRNFSFQSNCWAVGFNF